MDTMPNTEMDWPNPSDHAASPRQPDDSTHTNSHNYSETSPSSHPSNLELDNGEIVGNIQYPIPSNEIFLSVEGVNQNQNN